MHDVLRAGLVCLLGIPIALETNAAGAVFPLAITALLIQYPDSIFVATKQISVRLLAHLLAISVATSSLKLTQYFVTAELPLVSYPWLIGCILLLSLQLTRFRHPPSLASGGGVLAGLSYADALKVIVVTAIAIYLEFACIYFIRKIHKNKFGR